MSPPPRDTTENIIIIGASYAGLSTAHHLLQHVLPTLPANHSFRITLISPSTQTFCRPACPRAMLSDSSFDQAKLFVDTAAQLHRYPDEQWDFVFGRVENVDIEGRKVFVKRNSGEEESLGFYALVIASGASTSSPLLGLNSGSATDLRNSWNIFREALPKARQIVIAGGGPAGVEVAGEIAESINGKGEGWFSASSSSSTKRQVGITLITSAPQILPALRPSIAATAENYLSSLGVEIIKGVKVTSTSPTDSGTSTINLTALTKILLSNNETLAADIYIPATGTRPNTSFLTPDFLTETGHVNTNRQTLRVEQAQRIYALGDCSSAFRPAIHNILTAIPILSSNIHRDILLDIMPDADKSSIHADKHFKEDTRETQLVPIGTKRGVGAAMGWKMPSWVVWAIKGRDYWVWTTGKLWSGRQWG